MLLAGCSWSSWDKASMGHIIHGMHHPWDALSMGCTIPVTHYPWDAPPIHPPKKPQENKKRAPRGSLGPVVPEQGLGNKAAGCGRAGAARWYELQRISRVFMEHYVP